ncbi:hypothetical protein WA026_002886 [Henosepilachna vigintioctopunctata]|uniref:Uncharacterized protein n=1 Tax=Henosepilachna vigintioctopunctata TaxID=420089 RepID=A0AAW1TMI5_9CUCU
MVFDNCQIDVFFHMRSHYNRLRSVHSIVDCSAPKVLRRLNQSSTSLQYAGMAPYCNNNSGVKSHNCKYNTSCIPVSSPGPTACSPRAKSLPPRPGTRRHPDDMPFSRDMCSRSAKNPVRHQQESTKTTPVRTGRQNPTPRHRPKVKQQHHVPAIASVYYASKNTSSEGAKLESFHSRSDQDVRSNTSPTLTSVNQMPVSSSQYGEPKENPKYNTPISTPPRKPSNVSARDHEYLQFLLKITEDIIQNDLYTNKEMKKVFVSHFNANKERLDSDRMILQIHQLMQELNIPLSGDGEEDQSSSWSEIESALKGLGIEEVKQKGDAGSSDSKYKPSSSPQERCICFDIKNSDESSFNRRKVPEEEVENTNYDDYAPKNKFQSSLDRLTEHTEPISSQATCKASTVTSSSTFGQVDVLPGFESLETPRTARGGPTEKASMPQSPEKSERKVSYQGPSSRKNTKKHKRRKKSKTSRIKRPKSILKDSTCSKCVEKVCQASIVAQSRGTDPHTKELSSDNVTTKDGQKPLIITIKDGIENQTDTNNLFPENAKNDYTLIKGPIYLLKTFLVENPDLVMKIETPSVPSLVISKSSEAKHKICSLVNEPKNDEHQEVEEKLLPKTSSTDEVNRESKVLKTDLDSTSEKYKEIRNMLMQITSDLSLSSSSSSFDSKETIIPFEHFGSNFSTQTDVTVASKIATTSAMNFPGLSINTRCRNQSKCSQFCSALTSKPNLTVSNNKLLMTDAYDLTPQRDNDVDTSDMDQLIGEDYNVSSILENFLLTREIQTEDLHVEPTIVAFARMQKDELPGNSGIYPTAPAETSSTEEVTNILNSLGVNPGKSFSQNESKIGKKIKSAKKDTSKGYHRDPAEADNVKSVTLRDSVFAYPTSTTPAIENKSETSS